MALPTLSSRWSRPDTQSQLQRMHEKDNNSHHSWNETVKYYNRTTARSNMQNSWTSDQCSKKDIKPYITTNEKTKKNELIHMRRQKLFKLLQEENEKFQTELSGLSHENSSRLEEMKEKADTLKSAREEKNHEIAKQKLFEHWKRNNHELRSVETELHQAHIKEAWSHQLTERSNLKKDEEANDVQYANEYDEERIKAINNARKIEKERKKVELDRAEFLKAQIQDLKQRENESEILKQEEADILNHQIKLEQLELERNNMEKKSKGKELGRFLLRQCKAQLRRKAQQVQEELKFDQEILNRLLEKEEIMKKHELKKQEKFRQDIAWMKQVLEDQIKLEKKREIALDEMYNNEARQVWDKREREWKNEREARERLMREVLDKRTEQLHYRQEENKSKQKELLQDREELIANMENEEKTSRQEKNHQEKLKMERRDELIQQTTARKEKNITARQVQLNEIQAEADAEKEYIRFVEQEASRRRQMGYQENQHVRRKAWQ